jgi:hypothetical protein
MADMAAKGKSGGIKSSSGSARVSADAEDDDFKVS